MLRYLLFATVHKYAGRISLHEFQFLSNHFHLVLTDVEGCLPAFMQDLNSLITRNLNAIHGDSGTCIEKGYNDVTPQDDERVVRHAVYTLANACAAHLVRRTRQWTGLSSHALWYGDEVVAARPADGMWKYADEAERQRLKRRRRRSSVNEGRLQRRSRTTMPQVARIRLERPPIYNDLSDVELRKHILAQLAARENELESERRRLRLRVLGMRKVKLQSYWASPRTAEDMFKTTPSISASSKWTLIGGLRRRAAFVTAYARARDSHLAGDSDPVFPYGTWWMKRRFNVRCEAPP